MGCGGPAFDSRDAPIGSSLRRTTRADALIAGGLRDVALISATRRTAPFGDRLFWKALYRARPDRKSPSDWPHSRHPRRAVCRGTERRFDAPLGSSSSV
jgi:hypothetical protein